MHVCYGANRHSHGLVPCEWPCHCVDMQPGEIYDHVPGSFKMACTSSLTFLTLCTEVAFEKDPILSGRIDCQWAIPCTHRIQLERVLG